MKKVYYSWEQVEGAVLDIARQMSAQDWKPDYIVGITRGGLIPANLLSQYTGIKMHTLNVSLRDGDGGESNLWMAEEAFNQSKKILVVDDINDSGATLKWIKQDWQSSCLPNDPIWINGIWNNNVRVAVLYDNESSKSELTVDYSAVTINKAEEDVWIDFPWESWWTR